MAEMKAEKTNLIEELEELEEELSVEKITEIFPARKRNPFRIRRRRGKLTGRTAIRYAVRLAIVITCIAVTLQIYAPVVILHTTMWRTIRPGDCVVLAKLEYNFKNISNGDIVLYKPDPEYVDDGEPELVGRVIGLPGDTVAIKEGSVYRNDSRLDEPYVAGSWTDGVMAPFQMPEGYIFVLTDDRRGIEGDWDVETFSVPFDMVEGKVVFRLLPLSRAGKF